jgi:hypothetical protein
VALPSSKEIKVLAPGRTQPTVELEVPKSMPQARAKEGEVTGLIRTAKGGVILHSIADKNNFESYRLD